MQNQSQIVVDFNLQVTMNTKLRFHSPQIPYGLQVDEKFFTFV
jgi:hypothetical protein